MASRTRPKRSPKETKYFEGQRGRGHGSPRLAPGVGSDATRKTASAGSRRAPGDEPRWAASAKDGVGTALCPGVSSTSLVWFTLGRGALTEIYYPRVDRACTRDLWLVVTDGQDYFADERSDADHRIEQPIEGVPLYRLINTCRQGRCQVEKTVFAHPHQDAILQLTRFQAIQADLGGYHLYVLLSPQLAEQGRG